MDNNQIAHDLAIAKLYGSDLDNDKLIEKYRQYYAEIKECLNADSKPQTAKVIQNPFR